MDYVKKTETVTAVRWYKDGDHPQVTFEFTLGARPAGANFVERKYRLPSGTVGSTERACEVCGEPLNRHGLITAQGQARRVHPGDWVLTNVHGEVTSYSHATFERMYEAQKPSKAAAEAPLGLVLRSYVGQNACLDTTPLREAASTLKTRLTEVLCRNGEAWEDLESCVPPAVDMDRRVLRNRSEDWAFTAWTKRSVYFPVCYEGMYWVGFVPRHPTDGAGPTLPQGGSLPSSSTKRVLV